MRSIVAFSTVLFKAFVTASANSPSLSSDGKCRALALSGGGNYGAWEAGVLWGLLHYGDPTDYAWNVITGVSAGALNTCAAAVFKTGDELAMTEMLSNTWQTCSTD